jgi:glutamine amidotransferase
MQMLLDESEEFAATAGLGLIAGRVVPVPAVDSRGRPQKIPQTGWNGLVLPNGRASWAGTLLQDVNPGDAVYFVHSFMANPLAPEHRLADCVYGGSAVSAAIARDNVCGCQFHPEKSGEVGLSILKRFLAQ